MTSYNYDFKFTPLTPLHAKVGFLFALLTLTVNGSGKIQISMTSLMNDAYPMFGV